MMEMCKNKNEDKKRKQVKATWYQYYCKLFQCKGIHKFCGFYIFGMTILHLKDLRTFKGINMVELRF